MPKSSRTRERRLALATLAVGVLIVGVTGPGLSASAATPLTISTDPFTQSTCKGSAATNHHAEVEPDTFAFGATIVSAFQVGRIYDGGACAIGFATSTNNGVTWSHGLLPGLGSAPGVNVASRVPCSRPQVCAQAIPCGAR